MTPPAAQSDHPRLEFALIMAIFFVAGGSAAPHVNETHYLTKARHYWDPAYCPGDFFLDSADAHLAFYWTVGWLTKWLSLPATAWVGRIAAWLLLAAGWLRLTKAVTKAPWAAPFAALIWIVLVDKCDFAGEWVVGGLHGKGGVEGKCFAYGFVLLGLAALAGGRWTTPWVWFGAAAAMHVLVGGWAVLAGLSVWLGEPRSVRPALRAMLPGLLVGGLLSLPGLLPALGLDWDVPRDQADEAARIYVYERLPHHLAPATLPGDEFLRRSVRFGALVVAFASLGVWTARQRALDLGAEGSSPQGVNAAALARVLRFATFAIICNCIGLAIDMLWHDQPLAAARWLRYYWFRQADVVVPAATALAGACWAVQFARRSPQWARLAMATAMLLASAHLMRIAVDRVRHPEPPAVAGGKMGNVAAWLDVCDWIRTEAAPDVVCLVPRYAQSFKWHAERADVVNWKDIPQDAAGVIEWRRRLNDVFPTVETSAGPKVLASPEQWSATRVREVAARYGADYVIARSEPPLGLREVFSSGADEVEGGYVVYAVPGNDEDAFLSETP